jgi:hypothetical protein
MKFFKSALIIAEIDDDDCENTRQGHVIVMPYSNGMSSLCIHSTE